MNSYIYAEGIDGFTLNIIFKYWWELHSKVESFCKKNSIVGGYVTIIAIPLSSFYWEFIPNIIINIM